jgi:hypothetical protein
LSVYLKPEGKQVHFQQVKESDTASRLKVFFKVAGASGKGDAKIERNSYSRLLKEDFAPTNFIRPTIKTEPSHPAFIIAEKFEAPSPKVVKVEEYVGWHVPSFGRGQGITID